MGPDHHASWQAEVSYKSCPSHGELVGPAYCIYAVVIDGLESQKPKISAMNRKRVAVMSTDPS